jgi:ribonuclease HI
MWEIDKNLKQLIIVLDSAGGGNAQKYGPQCCFWCAFIYNPSKDSTETSKKIDPVSRYEVDILLKGIRPKPKRSGLIYSDYEGPNKIFYDGIIRALDSCMYLVKQETITQAIILGDCQPVINQLLHKRRINKLEKLYKQVKHYETEYRKLGCEIKYKWCGRNQFPLYEEIDRMTKEFLTKIKNYFKIS